MRITTARRSAQILVGLWAISLASCSMLHDDRSISAATWGPDYPFTIDGKIECGKGKAVLFLGGGKLYAVNGTATAQGYADIDPIWKDDPRTPGTKLSIGDVIAKGLTFCK